MTHLTSNQQTEEKNRANNSKTTSQLVSLDNAFQIAEKEKDRRTPRRIEVTGDDPVDWYNAKPLPRV